MNISDRKTAFIIVPVMALFFFAYSMLSFTAPAVFTSPDENVNFFFINHYAKTGTLTYSEPLNEFTYGYARPRNATATISNEVAPSGFPGLYIIYGTLVAAAPNLILFITPLIALFGGLCLFIISSTIFNRKVALLSLLLVFILPPYWFWSSMSMFNNIAASVFLVAGIAFLLLAIKKGYLGYYILTGLCFGLNHFFRLTDITYFLPLSYLIYSLRKQIKFKFVLASLLSYLFVITPLFISNKELFGSAFAFGYNPGLGSPENTSHLEALYKKIKFFLLPSGFNVDKIVFSFINYCLKLSPIIFIVGFIGILKYKTYKNKLARIYTISYSLLAIWILIYYGSGFYWGLNTFTLDASYIRYFLPIYMLIIPLAAYAISTLPKKLSISLLFVLVVTSIINVYQLSNGLIDMPIRKMSAEKQKIKIVNATEKNAIIITTLADKYLFPDRKVITYGPVFKEFDYAKFEVMIKSLSKKKVTLYLLNDRGDMDMKRVNKLLAKNHLKLYSKSEVDDLYKITRE